MTKPDGSMAELLALAVHELRTPVTVVSGYLRMLVRQQVGPLSERQQKILEEAERSCGRLTALVSELSELANLDAGSVGLAQHDVPLRDVLEEAAARIEEGRDRGVSVALTAPPGETVVAGDRARLSAALSALLLAVLREQAEPCEVSLSLEHRVADGRAMAAIGIGRDRAAARLFEAPVGVLNEFRGGLGMAVPIARRVIDQHGGRVWSSANGRHIGSVAVLLPLRESHS